MKGNMKLEKVFIFSRHGLRSPLTMSEEMKKATPYRWRKWEENQGILTKKGLILEVGFGQYIGEWLTRNGMSGKENGSNNGEFLNDDEIYIYTNNFQRTIATGQALSLGIFPGRNIGVNSRRRDEEMDPIFAAVVEDGSDSFKEKLKSEMPLEDTEEKLEAAYSILSRIIGYEKSEMYIKENRQLFNHEVGRKIIRKGKGPQIEGAITLATDIIDALLLQYYEGIPEKNIAGGNTISEDDWMEINKIKDLRAELLRGGETVASHMSVHLVKFMYEDMEMSSHRLTLLVGHDVNIVPLFSALGINKYTLKGQFEKTPIGGKVFFEVWHDESTSERKVRIRYVYQTALQIREGQELSIENPPAHQILEIKGCEKDKEGCYRYCDFIKVISDFLEKNRAKPNRLNFF